MRFNSRTRSFSFFAFELPTIGSSEFPGLVPPSLETLLNDSSSAQLSISGGAHHPLATQRV
jgi:hypothetical protein